MTGEGDDQAERRLLALETALAHAELAIADLSDQVCRQDRDLHEIRAEAARLRRLVTLLAERLDESPGGMVEIS